MGPTSCVISPHEVVLFRESSSRAVDELRSIRRKSTPSDWKPDAGRQMKRAGAQPGARHRK